MTSTPTLHQSTFSKRRMDSKACKLDTLNHATPYSQDLNALSVQVMPCIMQCFTTEYAAISQNSFRSHTSISFQSMTDVTSYSVAQKSRGIAIALKFQFILQCIITNSYYIIIKKCVCSDIRLRQNTIVSDHSSYEECNNHISFNSMALIFNSLAQMIFIPDLD